MFLIAGPCAIENKDVVMQTAHVLKKVCECLGIDLYFKSSFDKANRTSNSPRGIGMEEGLRILQDVKDTYNLKIITDVHESWQCAPVSQVADVLQIPSFLSRQTDLLTSAAKTGKIINVKKGQFMAPWDIKGAIQKIEQVDSTYKSFQKLWLTERGTTFGYGNLVVDMRSLVEMKKFQHPIIFDATHAVQQPSSIDGITKGNRELVPFLMRAALAVGIDGLFLEVHPNPDYAISDASNQVRLADIENLLTQALQIDNLIQTFE
ncbi:MAG: 3-deoxy-8-phosphooctulonate synthase [Paludibacteraceae bacterium]|nr:3-deoxy-8-phosphooctulonate synthase [Paludibacteraceae bacterium]